MKIILSNLTIKIKFIYIEFDSIEFDFINNKIENTSDNVDSMRM